MVAQLVASGDSHNGTAVLEWNVQAGIADFAFKRDLRAVNRLDGTQGHREARSASWSFLGRF